jgi:protease I
MLIILVVFAFVVLHSFSDVEPCLGQPRRSRTESVKIIQLPPPTTSGSVGLENTLAAGQSVRKFTAEQLDFTQIGQLAWAGQTAIEAKGNTGTELSDKKTYPISLYFTATQGTFLYNPQKHVLEEVIEEDVRQKLSAAVSGRLSVAEAACDIIIAGSTRQRGREPAQRRGLAEGGEDNKTAKHILLQTGQAAQNIRLEAVSLGLGCVSVDDFNARAVARVCNLPSNLEPFLILCVGHTAESQTPQAPQEQIPQEEPSGTDVKRTKKAVLIIASRNFRDEELIETKSELEKADITTVIASTKTGIIRGMLRAKAEAAILVNNINVDDYDAVIFIGGTGAREYFDSSVAMNLARQAKEKGKVLAAISIAPAVLADAGVLQNVKATSFTTEKYKLEKGGAQFTGAAVERDGLIITASTPRASTEFGKSVAAAITGR